MKTSRHIFFQQGQSLLEAIIAMAIFALVATSIATLALGSFAALQNAGAQTQAMALCQEGIEAVRSIKDGAWNELKYNQSKVAINSNQWVLSGESTTEQIGNYLRTINFSDVCRDAGNNFVDCPGVYTDIYSKKVSVTVSWPIRGGTNASVQQIAYLTNWQSQYWKEDVVLDFSDGSFQSTAVSPTLGDGDGAVILQMQ